MNTAVEFKNVDILFGKDISEALEMLDAGKSRSEILEKTSVVLGSAGANLVVKDLAGIELPRLGDQPLREIRIDPPVARLVGVGQRRAADRLAKAHVVELAGLRRKADLDVAQALPVRQLGKRHRPQLVLTAEALDPAITAEARHCAAEGVHRQMIHQLRENQLSLVHAPSPTTATRRSRARAGWDGVEAKFKSMTPPEECIMPCLSMVCGNHQTTDSGH